MCGRVFDERSAAQSLYLKLEAGDRLVNVTNFGRVYFCWVNATDQHLTARSWMMVSHPAFKTQTQDGKVFAFKS
jgi:hypothetical protein